MSLTLESSGFPRQTPQQVALFGGGRSYHLEWPTTEIRTSAPSLSWNGRRQWQSGNYISGAITGTTPTYQVSAGVPCGRFTGQSGAIPMVYTAPGGVQVMPKQTAPYFPPENDFSCWRCVVIAAFGGTNANAGQDYGAQVIYPPDGATRLCLRDGLGGFGFNRQSTGQAQFFVSPGGNFFNIPIAGFDPTLFHSYEIRVIGGNPGSPAQLRFFCDNVFVAQFMWGPGTILPGYIPATRTGNFQLVNNNTNPGVIDVYRMVISLAPSERALL